MIEEFRGGSETGWRTVPFEALTLKNNNNKDHARRLANANGDI